MMELVDMQLLNSCEQLARVGSNPTFTTIKYYYYEFL